jgi:hypothetical protein
VSLFGDFAGSLSRPFNETLSGFTTLFTNPTKAKISDVADVALPFWGGTLVSDFSHPGDILGQAAAVGAVMGGVALAGGSPLAAGAADPAPIFDANGFAMLPARAVPTLALSPTPGVFTTDAAAFTVPAAAPAAADSGWGSVLSKGASFVKETALVSAAAKSVLSPWDSAIKKGVQLATGGAARPGTTVIGGGGGPQGSASTASKPAPAPSLLASPVILAVGAVAVGWAVWTYLKSHRRLA